VGSVQLGDQHRKGVARGMLADEDVEVAVVAQHMQRVIVRRWRSNQSKLACWLCHLKQSLRAPAMKAKRASVFGACAVKSSGNSGSAPGAAGVRRRGSAPSA